MCGIAGIINSKGRVKHPGAMVDMQNSLYHRGPDAHGDYISEEGDVIFGHRRLSLVGLDKRATIMSVPKKHNEKYEVALVFNGEIYNFKELKRYFKKRGYISISPSDFEVIIFAWQEWGDECVNHLIGEFAFVLYDEELEETFMARDRTGVKPLFYSFTQDGEFVFGSESKAVLQYPDVEKNPDKSSIAEFFLMVHTFAAGNQNEKSSFYDGIKQFPPAHKATLDSEGFRMTRYYELPFTEEQNYGDNVSIIKKKLTKAVVDRVPEEVPTSIGLSGGLDSSIICALANRDKKAKKVMASSVRYSGDENSDYKHAKILAEREGVELSGPCLTPKDMISGIDESIQSLDGPVDSIRRMGMHANYKNIRENGYKITLIGEGADEFNLGYYHKFPGLKLDKEHCKDSESLKQLFRERVKYVSKFFTEEFKKDIDFEKIVSAIILENYEACQVEDPVVKMQHFYAKRFLLYLQDGNDRASMANSVEARLPFVDPDLIKASLAVPMEQNIVDGNEKNVLREAFKSMLPKEIYKRSKAPFPANEDLELHKLLLEELTKEIDSASASVWRVLKKESIEGVRNSFDNKIKELEEKYGENQGGQELTAWLPISGEVELRVNHIFSILTFIRWYRTNFN